MKIKTSELEGAALDWAVAQADDRELRMIGSHPHIVFAGQVCGRWMPSLNWAQGGPIMEASKVNVLSEDNGSWSVQVDTPDRDKSPYPIHSGPTMLIAAMRAVVAAGLGGAVDVPDELLPTHAVG